MKIGIDISQIIYEGTGVAEYTRRLVEELVARDTENEYILFYSHARKGITNYELRITKYARAKVEFKKFRIPIPILEFFWNRLHLIPIERFIGDVDVFLTSDWLEPPTRKAKKVTTIHDLSIFKTPEAFDNKIISVHKRKLKWVKKESNAILCDSKATRNDAEQILGIEPDRMHVVYPGILKNKHFL